MPRRRQHANTTLVVAAIVASFLIHGVLWPLGDKVLELSWSTPPVPRAGGVMEVALLAPQSEDDDEPPPEEPEDEPTDKDDQLVALDRVDDERPPPQETNFRSEFDSRVDKQTKAPNRRPVPGDTSATRGAPTDNPQRPTKDDDTKPSKALDLAARGEADDQQGQQIDEGSAADLARGKSLPRGATQPPAGLMGSASALQKTFGSPGTMDALDDIEPGSETSLNSKRTKYASFFNRVRNSVSQHWEPAEVHRAHDPDGRVFGAKTRRTSLVIRLNADGSLSKIMIAGSSDAQHLDEEAIRAVRQAAPFDNPPKGLVDPKTGFIEFGFGFIFELRGKKRIFRYRQ